MNKDEMVLAVSRVVDEWAEELAGQEPSWAPLQAVLPHEWCSGFMWMGRVEWHDQPIEVYKHGITRHSLHLDHEGQAYRYSHPDRYIKVTLDIALDHVFDGLEEMGWTRETAYDEEFIAAKHRALREAGYTVISSGPMALAESDENQGHQGK